MAKGSSTTYGGWESLVCARCGRAIVKSGPRAVGAMFNAFPAVWTLCAPCIPLGPLPPVEAEINPALEIA